MRVRVPPPALAVTLAAAAVLAALASRVGDWAVMTDELLYERLAIAIADGGLPRLHGELVSAYALVYPLLLAPVFALVELPGAIVYAHAWNGVVFASAALPTYLLARRLPVPAWTPWLAAVFAVAVPWSVVTGFVMTEAAAYPAALWALFAIQRVVVEPTDRAYVLALVAVGVATLARTQLAILVLVLVLVAAVQELRVRRGWRTHRVLIAAMAIGALLALLLAAVGTIGSALGSYAPTLEGALFSGRGLRAAAVHLDVVAVAIGLVPLIAGAGWAAETIVRRPSDPESYAFAALTFVTVVVLALQVGSFVTRFGLGVDVKDRYLFYIAPLLFVATAVAFTRRAIAGTLAATVFVVLTAGWERFEPIFGVSIDSPAAATHEVLTRNANRLGVSASTLVALAAAAAGAAVVVALRSARRTPFAAVALGGVTLFSALGTAYTWDRLLDSSHPGGRPIAQFPPEERAWVDRAVPDGANVGMLAYSVGQDWYPSALAWWDVEFWNASVTRAYLVGEHFAYTPETFPRHYLAVDPNDGSLLGESPRYLVRTTNDARFGPVGRTLATAPDMEVVELEQPARAAWLSIGLTADGWTTPATGAALRVYGNGHTDVRVTVNSPEQQIRYTVGSAHTGTLGPTEFKELHVVVCVPPGGFVDIPVAIEGTVAVRDIPVEPPYADTFRHVGARLSRISATSTGSAC